MQWLRSIAWLGTVAAASTVIALISAAMQRAGVAPIVLSSLLIGAALGSAVIASAWYFQVKDRRMRLAGTVVGAALLVASQHIALYSHHVGGWEQAHQEQPELSLFRDPMPQPLGEYLQQEGAGGRWWLWLLDALIVTATAVGVVAGAPTVRGKANMD